MAHAAAAAAAAYRSQGSAQGDTASLGSAVAGPPAYLVQGRPIPLLMTATPTMPSLARAAALAAQRAGRAPEEIWAEALQVWLEACAGRDELADASGDVPISPHRQRAWQEIEETLRLLRAS